MFIYGDDDRVHDEDVEVELMKKNSNKTIQFSTREKTKKKRIYANIQIGERTKDSEIRKKNSYAD